MDNAEGKYVCIEPRWYTSLDLRTAVRMSWDNMFSCAYHNLDLRRLLSTEMANTEIRFTTLLLLLKLQLIN